jgi:hypothetical protein
VISLKRLRLIMLSIVAGLLGICIGRAPSLGPGNSWLFVLYLATAGVIAVIIVEVCGQPRRRKRRKVTDEDGDGNEDKSDKGNGKRK